MMAVYSNFLIYYLPQTVSLAYPSLDKKRICQTFNFRSSLQHPLTNHEVYTAMDDEGQSPPDDVKTSWEGGGSRLVLVDLSQRKYFVWRTSASLFSPGLNKPCLEIKTNIICPPLYFYCYQSLGLALRESSADLVGPDSVQVSSDSVRNNGKLLFCLFQFQNIENVLLLVDQVDQWSECYHKTY